jgi:hypothetical protein
MEIRTSKSEKTNPSEESPEAPVTQTSLRQDERYYDRSNNMVARVRRAKEATQRDAVVRDPCEYGITILQGQLKEDEREASPALLFPSRGPNPSNVEKFINYSYVSPWVEDTQVLSSA